MWIPVILDNGLNFSADAEKFATPQSVTTDDGVDVSVDATNLAVWKSVVLGDEGNLVVLTKEVVRRRLVSPKDGCTFVMDTDVLAS